MPYDSVTALPEDVRNSLPADAQDVWMGAFNGAHKDGKDEASCAAIAWSAIEKSGWSKDKEGNWKKQQTAKEFVDQSKAIIKIIFPFLNLSEDHEQAAIQIKEAFANSGDIEVEIFSAGTWNGDEYTVADLQDMAKNFSLLAAEIKPPVKLGHNDEGLNKIVSDGQPAYGWVKSVKVVGEKLMAVITQVPEVLKKAIKAGRYKRVSSEIYWNLKKKSGEVYRRVLGAVAFLGADAPAVTNLADLEALFTRSTGAAPGSFEGSRRYTFATNDGEHITEERRKAMTDAEKLAQLEAEAATLRANNEVLLKANLSERKRRAATTVREYCDAHVKAGTMIPATRDTIMKGISEEKFVYSDEGEGMWNIPFHMFKVVNDRRQPGKAPMSYTKKEGSLETELDIDENEEHEYSEGGNVLAQDVLHRKAEKYAAEKKVDYSTALKVVCKENPKLARAYIEQTPLVKHEGDGSRAADVDSE